MKFLKMKSLTRRHTVVLSVLLLPMLTFGIRVSDLPVCEYADTEVATNMPFRVSLDEMSRTEVSLSLIATPTNVVEVSIGTDANGDGELSSVAAKSRRPSALKSSAASPAWRLLFGNETGGVT